MPSVLANETVEELESDEETCCGEVLHVYPDFGRTHELSWDCWCRPRGEWQNGTPIWVHEVYH